MTVMMWILTIPYILISIINIFAVFINGKNLIEGLINGALMVFYWLFFTAIYWGFFIWLDIKFGFLHWF